ncbi:unnamed protein product, partial [Bodo saltans]
LRDKDCSRCPEETARYVWRINFAPNYSAGLESSEPRLEEPAQPKIGPALLELNPYDILFSDESYFDTCDTHRSAYQRDGEAQQTRPTERSVTKVMVWGVIGVGYATLVIMNSGTVNATQYVETLKEYLVPKIDTTRHIFMQDGASAHTAKFTQESSQSKTFAKWSGQPRVVI